MYGAPLSTLTHWLVLPDHSFTPLELLWESTLHHSNTYGKFQKMWMGKAERVKYP
jgi:hypothetical protein